MPMNTSTVLEVSHLVKTFPLKTGERSITVINNMSFNLFKGESLGVLGPNGAGKTTLIKMLLSVLTPTSGTIEYFGKNFFTERSSILEKVSFASSYVQLPARLTVRTNLDIYAQLYGVPYRKRAHRIEQCLKFFGIWNLADKETGILSAGQMTRVMLAKAFVSYPKIVLLDEPTASLDPDSALEARTFIKEQQKEYDIALLLTSHSMEEVTQICDRVLVIKQGTIIANDTPHNLAFSAAPTRVLFTTKESLRMCTFFEQRGLRFQHTETAVVVEVDEQGIAPLLAHITHEGITYSHISIDSPNLNDYFLSIAKEAS
jgi:ABC-2 type transport system ATP-binding protein